MSNKIAIIQRVFSNYRKPVYDKLALKNSLLLLHSENASGIKTAQAEYSKNIQSFSYRKKDTGVYLCCVKEILKFSPSILIHEFAVGILSLPVMFLLCKLKRIKIILWSHGYDRQKGFYPEKSIADKYRLFLMKKADAILLYGEKDRIKLSTYINKDKIFVATNTLNTDSLLRVLTSLEKEGRVVVKKRIGFEKKFNLIFIGRLLKDKRPEVLIDLLALLPSNISEEIHVHFIGNGHAQNTLKTMIRDKDIEDRVTFHGSIHEDELVGELLYASDLMIMPTYAGLAVNHALCFQCPVIIFEDGEKPPFHGPEEAYVIEGITGYRIKNHDLTEIAAIISTYLDNPLIQSEMRKAIKKYVESNLLMSHMVKGIDDCITYVSK